MFLQWAWNPWPATQMTGCWRAARGRPRCARLCAQTMSDPNICICYLFTTASEVRYGLDTERLRMYGFTHAGEKSYSSR